MAFLGDNILGAVYSDGNKSAPWVLLLPAVEIQCILIQKIKLLQNAQFAFHPDLHTINWSSSHTFLLSCQDKMLKGMIKKQRIVYWLEILSTCLSLRRISTIRSLNVSYYYIPTLPPWRYVRRQTTRYLLWHLLLNPHSNLLCWWERVNSWYSCLIK